MLWRSLPDSMKTNPPNPPNPPKRNTIERLLAAVDALDGIASIPYREAKELAIAADAVRVALGRPTLLWSEESRERTPLQGLGQSGEMPPEK